MKCIICREKISFLDWLFLWGECYGCVTKEIQEETIRQYKKKNKENEA